MSEVPLYSSFVQGSVFPIFRAPYRSVALSFVFPILHADRKRLYANEDTTRDTPVSEIGSTARVIFNPKPSSNTRIWMSVYRVGVDTDSVDRVGNLHVCR